MGDARILDRMALLSDGDIRRYIAKGELRIEQFDEKNLTPNGYDVTIEEVLIPSSNDRDVECHVVLRRRVCADRVELKIPDLQVGLCGDSLDAVCRGTLVCPFQDTIHVDHPARPDRRERVR